MSVNLYRCFEASRGGFKAFQQSRQRRALGGALEIFWQLRVETISCALMPQSRVFSKNLLGDYTTLGHRYKS
jgi:hypothetical protein